MLFDLSYDSLRLGINPLSPLVDHLICITFTETLIQSLGDNMLASTLKI